MPEFISVGGSWKGKPEPVKKEEVKEVKKEAPKPAVKSAVKKTAPSTPSTVKKGK
jgi:hypothetical protein